MDKELLERASPSEREFYQDKVRKINEAILEEIKKAQNKLFEIMAFPPLYKDFPGDIDYKTFVGKLGTTLEQKAPHGLLWAIKNPEVEKSLSEIEDKESSSEHLGIISTGYLFLSPKYTPPKKLLTSYCILRHYICGLRLTQTSKATFLLRISPWLLVNCSRLLVSWTQFRLWKLNVN